MDKEFHGLSSKRKENERGENEDDDVKKDLEGLQTLRNLARNMSFMIKAFAKAKEEIGYPELESGVFTNFITGK